MTEQQNERLEFVKQMVKQLRAFFLSSDPVISLNVDGGGAVTYDRKGAWEMLQELERELKPKRCISYIDLSQAF
jgi:hypothetical protein